MQDSKMDKIKLAKYKHDWYMKNRERMIQNAKEWHKNHPEAFKKAMRKYRLSHQEGFARRAREYYQRHKEKCLAEDKIQREKNNLPYLAHNRSRTVPLKTHCERCGTQEKLEKRHPDYSKPKLVITLCKLCHESIPIESQQHLDIAGTEAREVFDAGIEE